MPSKTLLLTAIILILAFGNLAGAGAQEVQSSVDADFKPVCVEAVLTSSEVRPGGQVAVTLRFRNEGTSSARTDYIVFTHVEFPEKSCANIIIHADHQPTIPTTCWEPGELISDGAHLLKFPSDAQEGVYHIHVGIYSPADPGGPRLSDQYVGEIVVSHDAPEIVAIPPAMDESEIHTRRNALSARVKDPETLEDDRIAFRISRSTGAWEIVDKTTGESWHSNPSRACLGRIHLTDGSRSIAALIDSFSDVRRDENRLLLTYTHDYDDSSLDVLFTIKLLPDRGLRFECSDTSAQSASPKWRVESVRLLDDSLWVTDTDGGYFAVPERLGTVFPASEGLPNLKRYTAYSNHRSYSMAMLGIEKNGSALLLHWDDPYTVLEVNRSWPDLPLVPGHGMVSASLILSKSARSFVINPIGRGAYAEIASAYREVARERGFLSTWREKTEVGPHVESMLGAANFKPFVFIRWLPNTRFNRSDEERLQIGYSFEEAAQVAEHLRHKVGIDRAMFVLAGWIHRGYDNQHPDILPAAPECGGTDALIDCARRVNALGYLFGLHDNYQDMYRDAPSWNEDFIMKKPDGSLRPGGEWAGGLAYLTCSKKALELAMRKQNLPAVRELFDPRIYFIDTTFAAPPFECFDPEHPLSLVDDIYWKTRLSEYTRETFGLFGNEEGQEWGVPCADYFEGLMSHRTQRGPGETIIPLFPMVYGDCINLYAHQGDRATVNRPEYILDHILYAQMPLYHLGPHLYFKEEDKDAGSISASVHSFKQTGDREFVITYAWNVDHTPPLDYRCFVHFTSPEASNPERIAFQNDHDFERPTSTWQSGETVLDGPYTVRTPDGMQGPFRILIGLTDEWGRVSMSGRELGNRRYHIGKISLKNESISFESSSAEAERVLFFGRNEGDYAHLIETDRFIRNTYEILSPLNIITAHTPITAHEFLTDDRQVERTRFGDVEITVNYGNAPYRADGTVLPKYGFLVESPGFVAFYATEYADIELSQATMVVVRSMYGAPLAESGDVKLYRAFGDRRITVAGREFEF